MNIADESTAIPSKQDAGSVGAAASTFQPAKDVRRPLRSSLTAWPSGYALAVVAVAVAAGAGAIIHLITDSSYLFPLLFAVILTAWYGGLRLGLFALALALVVGAIFLFSPSFSNGTASGAQLISLTLFGGLALSIVLMAARGRASLLASAHTERAAREALGLAERAITQLRQVQEITDVALNHLDLDNLLHALLLRVGNHVRGDTTSVFLLDDDGITLAERSSTGLREQVGEHPRIKIGEGFAGRIGATGEPLIIGDLSTVAVASQLLRERMRSAVGAPIFHDAGLIGVIVVGSTHERNFAPEDLTLLELVAARMAAAIDHAQLFEQAQETTAELTFANSVKDEAVARHLTMEEHLSLLVDASGKLIESLQIDDMLPQILRLTAGVIAADAYAVWSMDDERLTWSILASEGLSESYLARQSTIPVTPDTPRMPNVVVAEDVTSQAMLGDRSAGYAEEGIQSLLALPLRIGGAETGSLTFYYRSPHTFKDEEIRIATALANLSSSAIGLAKLHDDERRARDRVEEANKKLAFLARASDVLSESLDYEDTLQKVAQLSVPLLADWCGVNVLGEPGEMRTIAVAHRDPEKLQLAHELEARYPTQPDPQAEHGWPRVVRTREPDLMEEIPEEMIRLAAKDEEHLRLIQELGLRSSLVVPLIARDTVLGALTLVTADLHPPLTSADLPLAQELARRAAIAIDNAQLYREAQRVAQDLQEANAAKDEFLGLVSHELRTPITVILGDSDVLIRRADRIDDETRTEVLHDINSEAERLNRIIENLLILARMEQRGVEEIEPVRLENILSRLLEAHRGRAPWRTLTLDADLSRTLVVASDFCIEQTARNFLSNAEKYSPRDQPIEVVVGVEHGAATVRVLDRGPGLTSDETDSLFEPFYRSSSTSHISGVGIGLTVCKRLVEACGGRVWALPREGGGAEFGFSLPLAAVPEAGEPALKRAPRNAAS